MVCTDFCVLIFVVSTEAKSDSERGWFDWCCNGRSSALLWLFHQVIVSFLAVLTQTVHNCFVFSSYFVCSQDRWCCKLYVICVKINVKNFY